MWYLPKLERIPARPPVPDRRWERLWQLEAERDRLMTQLELWENDNEDELRDRLDLVEDEMRYLL